MATYGAPRPGLASAARPKKPFQFGVQGLVNRKFRLGAGPQAGFKARPVGGATPPRLGAQKPGKPVAPAAPGRPPARPAPGARAANVPPDSAYNQQVSTINRAEQNQLTQLQGQQQQTKFNFGIDDPTNPFSRAEGLKQAYLANLKGTSASLASQGHLYSGQHERALSRVRFNQERDYASLRQAYMDALGQIGNQQASVQTNSELQRDQAFADWLARAPDNAAPLPTDPAAGGAGGAAAKAAPPTPAGNRAASLLNAAAKVPPKQFAPGKNTGLGKIPTNGAPAHFNDPVSTGPANYGKPPKLATTRVKAKPKTPVRKRGRGLSHQNQGLFGRKLPR